MLEGKQYQINCFFKAHDEAGHIAIGQRNRITLVNLINPQRNDAATAAHDIAVAGTANLGLAAIAALSHSYLFLDSFGDTHGVDGIGGLIRGQADHTLHTGFDGGSQHVVRANDIGAHGFHGEELAGGYLFQRSRMENVVHAMHGITTGLEIADIANVELDLIRYLGHGRLEMVAHIILFLFIAGKNADLDNIRAKKTVEHSITK